MPLGLDLNEGLGRAGGRAGDGLSRWCICPTLAAPLTLGKHREQYRERQRENAGHPRGFPR